MERRALVFRHRLRLVQDSLGILCPAFHEIFDHILLQFRAVVVAADEKYLGALQVLQPPMTCKVQHQFQLGYEILAELWADHTSFYSR